MSKLEGGGQVTWDFAFLSSDSRDEAIPRYSSPHPAVLFEDPDPRRLWVGNQRLEHYLKQQGLGEVLAFRQLVASIDWSPFLIKYHPGGRPPFHPRTMVGLVLFGITQGHSSLRALEVLAASDVRCWWMTGGLCPDHSAIGNFINRHQELLTEVFFEELTRRIILHTGSDCSRVASDGTVIESVSSRMHKLKLEAAKQKAKEAVAQAEAHPEDKARQKEAERATKEAQTVEKRLAAAKDNNEKKEEVTTCPNDPESVINQTKGTKAFRPSYVPSVLANKDRLITAQTVDPTNEISVVGSLLEQSERISGQKVEELLQDGGYFCAAMVVLCMIQDINWLCPQGRVEQNAKSKDKKKYAKSDFCYDEARDQYRCPAGQFLVPENKSADSADRKGYRRYRCHHCDHCPNRTKCTNDPKGRSVKRRPVDELLDAEREVMKQPKARASYRKRKAMVEPVFGEQRHIQGLQRFHRRGLKGVKLEYSLHSSAHNVRRYLVLVGARCGNQGVLASNGGRSACLPRQFLLMLHVDAVVELFCDGLWSIHALSPYFNTDSWSLDLAA